MIVVAKLCAIVVGVALVLLGLGVLRVDLS